MSLIYQPVARFSQTRKTGTSESTSVLKRGQWEEKGKQYRVMEREVF